ncbi:MAG: hypothetical protein OSA88_00220 [Acidimicrobiales bacterium]|nr:hypothetical protein [Acidimicrobiales bacterium]
MFLTYRKEPKMADATAAAPTRKAWLALAAAGLAMFLVGGSSHP